MHTQLHDLGLVAAAEAIRNGEISSESYVTHLVERSKEFSSLNAFITIDEPRLLESARAADLTRPKEPAALWGVPIAVKDSYLTRGIKSSLGTGILSDYVPSREADVVRTFKKAGALVFGKNNLEEMSFGLTGKNFHYGQVRNPYDVLRVTGGSSSGGAASVSARIVPAALGGDTIGSIRVPAALCGVVGFKPTLDRWPGSGAAPIAEHLDVVGVLARNVEDCAILDAIVTGSPRTSEQARSDLKNVRLAYAPKQYLEDADPEVVNAFNETLRKLKDAGAEIVEIDLGAEFIPLAQQTTFGIFFHETKPSISRFLTDYKIPASFEEIYEGLHPGIKAGWEHFALPAGSGYPPEGDYQKVLAQARPELQRRFRQGFAQAPFLLFPTTPCAAPLIDSQFKFTVAGKEVTDLFLANNTVPSSGAGLPGISIPMSLTGNQLPLGLEVAADAGQDIKLLDIARRIQAVLGHIPGPKGFA
jgi:Asp-tRNA(Asn)/Glu-tRNA(Gln) amidotransferase A subunit family amidase